MFDEEELSFKLNTKILKNIKIIINNTLFRVAKSLLKNNSEPFSYKVISNQKWFVEEKEKNNDFKIIGHKNFNRQYIFGIDIDENHYLHKIVEQIQLSFYLDEKNNLVSGGFSFNWGNKKKQENNFQDISDAIFNNDVTNFFISKNIENISLNKIISLLEEKNENLLNNNFLYDKWIFLLKKRFPNNYKDLIKSKKSDEWFYSILITLCVSLMIYEDLRKYFTHKNPVALNNKLSKYKQPLIKFENVANDNLEVKKDFAQIIALVKKSYLYNFETDDIKNLDDFEDLLEEVWTFEENESFMNPIPSFEITRDSDQGFIDEKQNIFQNNNDFKTFFLIALMPNLFGLNEDSDRYISYEKYCSKINLLKNNVLLEETLEDWLETYICEWNYDYATFINKNLSFLIVKNKNPKDKFNFVEIDVNRKIYNNYFWSIIYSQSRLWKLWVIEEEFNKEKNAKPKSMRRYLYELNNLQYDWNDDFYGMKEIKKIVKKVSDYNNVENSLNELIKKINRTDHTYGKFRERINTKYALFAAFIFGVLDFFTTIFSILPVTRSNQLTISTAGITFLSIGGVIGFVFMISSIIGIYKIYFHKKVMHWWENRDKK